MLILIAMVAMAGAFAVLMVFAVAWKARQQSGGFRLQWSNAGKPFHLVNPRTGRM